MSYPLKLIEEQIKLYEERCRPDHYHIKNSETLTTRDDFYSDTGFISNDDSLIDVCLKDDKTVMSLLGEGGHELIGKTIFCFMNYNKIDAVKEFHPQLYVDINTDNYIIEAKPYFRGSQKCPFVDKRTSICVDDCLISNSCFRDFMITNKINKETLNINVLTPHLIYHHHFYQGNVPHRISPEKLITFFNIKK